MFVALFVLALFVFVPASHAQSGPVVWVARSLQRVGSDDTPGSALQAQLSAARGESESFQIVVRAPGSAGLSNVNVTVSDLAGPGGAVIPKRNLSLFREHYVYIGTSSPNWGGSNRPLAKGWYPDGLIPFTDPQTGNPLSGAQLTAVPFSLNAAKNQPIWVDVLVPRNATAGVYAGTFTVTSNQGNVSGQISLTVWNFTLPMKPALGSSFLTWTTGSTATHQELLRNRINPQKAAVTDERSLIDSLGLASRDVGFWSGADMSSCTMSAAPTVSQFSSAAATHQSGLMLYDYSADEIWKCTNLYPTIKQWAANMHQAGINNLITMAPVPELYDDGSGSGRSAVDIWVMLPILYDKSPSNVQYVVSKGDQAWSYNCLVQDAYSPKWLIDFNPMDFRVQPGFINQSLNLTGILYWRVDLWSSDPWNNVYSSSFPTYPGEGMLVYPGTTVGIQGVAPSMRLKWLRDGADDYDYIDLLKKAGQGTWALQVAAGVGANWSQWSRDGNVAEAARVQLGQKLDTLGGGSLNPPAAATNPSPQNAATGVSLTPTLTWTADGKATAYDVYFGTSASPSMAGTTATTNFSPGTLSGNTTYFWRVVARNSAGSASSATWSFTTLQPAQAPGTPGNLAPANGASGVSLTPSLTWSAASNATSYDVYFGTSSSPSMAGSTGAAGYNPGTLSGSTTYYWRVVAKNSTGSTSSYTCSFRTLQPAQAPGTPGNLAPANGASGVSLTPSLTWSAASNATSYDVYFGTSSSPSMAGTTATAGYNPGTLSGSTTYYWRVVAKNSTGSTSSYTCSFTTTATGSLPPATPTSVSPSSGSGYSQTFTFVFSAQTGVANANVLINAILDGMNGCWFNYNVSSKALSLARNDTSVWDYATIGSSATLQNSQCALLVQAASAVASASSLTLTVPVTFTTTFGGQKNDYLRMQDGTGLMNNFVAAGTWGVPSSSGGKVRRRDTTGSVGGSANTK